MGGLSLGLLALALQLAWPMCAMGSGPARPLRPNFVFILCDDLGFNDLGCYTYPSKANPGPPPPLCPIGYTNYVALPTPNSAFDGARPGQTLTPHLDRMAAEGVRLTSFYSGGPVCSPSRAALMTGCYPYRVGINSVLGSSSNKGLHTAEITVAEVLKNQGYATAIVGKWHLGHRAQFLPTRQGFDEYFGIPYSNDMTPVNLYENETSVEFIGPDPLKQGELTGRYTARALEFLERRKDRPFFLYLAHTMPHVPVYASPAFAGASGKSDYYDVVMEIDWSTGQILEKLAQLGLDGNTLVMFSSDNGPWNSRGDPNNTHRAVGSAYPLRESKGTTGEGGLRVPFLARWPGQIPAGQVRDDVGGFIDILPTLARLAGTTPPGDRVIDGRDLWPVLAGEPGAVSPHQELYYFKNGNPEAVRSGAWKWRRVGSNPLINYLANLDSDIQELTNVAGVYPAVFSQLQLTQSNFYADITAQKRPQGVYSSQEIVLHTNRINVARGGVAAVLLKLAEPPLSNITVGVEWISGNTNLSVCGPAALVFTRANWNVYQQATVAAQPATNLMTDTATLRCSSAAFEPAREVFVTESETSSVAPPVVCIRTPRVNPVRLPDRNHSLYAEGAAAVNTGQSPAEIRYRWKAWPAGVIFDAPDSAGTGLIFSQEGDYTLRLTASRNGLEAFAEVGVEVGASNPVPAGVLVARLPFDEASGTVAGDGSGGGHHGQLSGEPAWQPAGGNFRGALEFAGTNHLVTIADSNEINLGGHGQRTIALWFKPAESGISTGTQILYEEGGTTRGLNLYLSGGRLYAGGWNNGENGWTNTYLAGEQSLSAGRWHHAALVLNASDNLASGTFRAYLDGAEYATGHAATLSEHTDDIGIGGIAQRTRLHDGSQPRAGSHSFFGLVDELLIYNRALSAEEIVQIAAGRVNLPPHVSAGRSQEVAFSAGARLQGSFLDDGLPIAGGLSHAWSQVDGPGSVQFLDPASLLTQASFDLPGLYQLRLTVDDGRLCGHGRLLVNVAPLTYPEWQNAQSLPDGQQGMEDDPDQDGWPNLFEFGLGLDPMAPDDSGGVRRFSWERDGDTIRLTLRFERPRDRAPMYHFEESEHLREWHPVPTVPVLETLPGGRERASYILELPARATRRFVRLGISPQ